MSELVTGDAVVLGLRPARVPSRALAVCIDLAVLWSVYLALFVLLLTAVSGLDPAAEAAIAVALLVLVLMGGPVAVETLSHGRSLGKAACGLRVVREDGGPVRFRHALVRGLLGFVEIQMTLGVVACCSSLVSGRGRRLGDVFAGTLVVRERNSAPRVVPAPPPPPWLAHYFDGLDLSRVPDPLWLAVRQYLTRMPQLDPQVSRSLAERLGADVARCTGAPPPEGVPAAAYLTGVVAERQARDSRRAFGGAAADGRTGHRPGVGAAGGPAQVAAEQQARREQQARDGQQAGDGQQTSGQRPSQQARDGQQPGEAAPGADTPRPSGGFAPPS